MFKKVSCSAINISPQSCRLVGGPHDMALAIAPDRDPRYPTVSVVHRLITFLLASSVCLAATPPKTNEVVQSVIDAVSSDRISRILEKLESFETRHTFSETGHPTRGIGAARRWIYEQMSSYSPRLEVRYDAVLAWDCSLPAPNIAGYALVMRKTTSPYWEKEVFVGLQGEHRFPGMSIDEWAFGVKAIDRDGNESLVSPYVAPERKRVKYELY